MASQEEPRVAPAVFVVAARMNTTIAIVLAVGVVGAAVLVLRRQADAEGVDLCTKLGAIDGKASMACSILGALGIDSKTVGNVAKGVVQSPKFAAHAVTSAIESGRDAVGLGGDGDPCTGSYGIFGFRSLDCCHQWRRSGTASPFTFLNANAGCKK